MDYNYVRMRNAAARGDMDSAERYRSLYERGRSGAEPHLSNIIIILLTVVAVALGLYIRLAAQKSRVLTVPENTVVTAEPFEEPDVVSQPGGGADENPQQEGL